MRQEILSAGDIALAGAVKLVVQTETARFPKTHYPSIKKIPLPFEGRDDDSWPSLLQT